MGEYDSSIYQGLRCPGISPMFDRVDIPSVAAAKATMNSWTEYKGGVPNSVWPRMPAYYSARKRGGPLPQTFLSTI